MLPSNTPFPPHAHLSRPVRTVTQLALPHLFLCPRFSLQSQISGFLCTGQLVHGCCHTEPNLPFPWLLPSRQMTAAVNPLALLSTWIQFVVVEKAQCIAQLQGALFVPVHQILKDAEPRTVPEFLSSSQVIIPA